MHRMPHTRMASCSRPAMCRPCVGRSCCKKVAKWYVRGEFAEVVHTFPSTETCTDGVMSSLSPMRKVNTRTPECTIARVLTLTGNYCIPKHD